MSEGVSERDDIQGILWAGYGTLKESAFLLLRIADAAAARTWIATHAPTSIADLDRQVPSALQIAVTAAGLRALGCRDEVISGFSPEFTAGMAGDEERSRRLGDVAANAPGAWDWGIGAQEPHLLLMLYGTKETLPALLNEIDTADFHATFGLVKELPAAELDEREPFGFPDGGSQPWIDWTGDRELDTSADLEYGNLIAAGEFLLGYANEYGRYTERPLLDAKADPTGLLSDAADNPGRRDLGRNGSYLVFRQLDQDVRGFWNFLGTQGSWDEAIRLAESMVGRKISGEPLVAAGERPIRGVGMHPKEAKRETDIRLNGFTFDRDAEGLACPLGAHIRRANPRTGDMPGGRVGWIVKILGMLGLIKRPPRADVVASSRFHRILRRGRDYGYQTEGRIPLPSDAPEGQSGLYFICLNANIARQFEFIQSAWIVSAKFDGLSGESDPLLGGREPFPAGHATDGFSVPQSAGPCRYVTGLPRFVTVRGGAYFFLPSLRALRYLAALKP